MIPLFCHSADTFIQLHVSLVGFIFTFRMFWDASAGRIQTLGFEPRTFHLGQGVKWNVLLNVLLG